MYLPIPSHEEATSESDVYVYQDKAHLRLLMWGAGLRHRLSDMPRSLLPHEYAPLVLVCFEPLMHFHMRGSPSRDDWLHLQSR